MKRLRYDRKIQKEIDSPTIVDSFTSLLKRARVDQQRLARDFKVSLDQLKRRSTLYLDSPIFSHRNLAWECALVPSSSDERAFDFRLRCLEPPVVVNRLGAKRVYGSIMVVPFTDGICLLKHWVTMPFTDTEIVISDLITGKMIDECVGDHLKFGINFSFHPDCILPRHTEFWQTTSDSTNGGGYLNERDWRRNKDLRRYWRDSFLFTESELNLPFAEVLTRHFIKLLSESTLKSSYNYDYCVNPYFLSWSLSCSSDTSYCTPMAKTGVYKLMAKLLSADFSECFDSSIWTLRGFVDLLYFSSDIFEDTNPTQEVQAKLREVYDDAFVNIVDKFYDTRYRLDLLAYLAVRGIPMLAYSQLRAVPDVEEIRKTRMITKTMESLDVLLPFLDVRTQIVIMRQPDVNHENLIYFCAAFQKFASHGLRNCLAGNRSPMMKELLELVCENMTNPFFNLPDISESIATFQLLESRLRRPSSTVVRDWCQRNAHLNPGIAFPATAKRGLIQLEKLVDAADKGIRVPTSNKTCMDLLISSYKFYVSDTSFPDSMKEGGRSNMQTDAMGMWMVELMDGKDAANELHKTGKFREAVKQYTEIMKKIKNLLCYFGAMFEMAARLNFNSGALGDRGPAFFAMLDLMNKCRSNRSASYLELKKYEEALADSILAINELASFIDGSHPKLQGTHRPVEPFEKPKLEARLLKGRLRRLKILMELEAWIPALNNAMDLLMYGQGSTNTLADYYRSLVRCKSCRHPFCSETCYQKDHKHKAYCTDLTKLRKSKKFREFYYLDVPC